MIRDCSITLLFLIILSLFLLRASGQGSMSEKEKPLFEEYNVSFSFVNIGTIHHWTVPTNIDEHRPYMHYTLGVEGRFSDRWAIRLDYFSNYNNFTNATPFFNPSVITIAPRIYFAIAKSVNLFADVKLGIANISDGNNPDWDGRFEFAGKPPIVMGLKTGLTAELSKHFSLGFGFDNLGIHYKYVWTSDNSTEYDASRISILTTDIVYHFGRKS